MMIYDVKYLFICLLDILWVSIKIFAHFKIGSLAYYWVPRILYVFQVTGVQVFSP